MVKEDTEVGLAGSPVLAWLWPSPGLHVSVPACNTCLLYTSDAADDWLVV